MLSSFHIPVKYIAKSSNRQPSFFLSHGLHSSARLCSSAGFKEADINSIRDLLYLAAKEKKSSSVKNFILFNNFIHNNNYLLG